MTDYCTLFPEGTWAQCCAVHDMAYAGDVDVTKWQADVELFQCVAQSSNYVVAAVMLIGVTLFGWLFYKGRK